MKTIVRYECEVCGLEHVTQESAKACEDCKPPPLPYKKGDEVIVQVGRKKPRFQVCHGTHLQSYLFGQYASQYSEEDIAQAKERDCWKTERFHHWVIDIDEEIYFGEEYFSSSIGVFHVMRRIRLLGKQEQIKALAKKLSYTDLIIHWGTANRRGVSALMRWEDIESHQKRFKEFGVKCKVLPIPKAETK